jgi:hypothetical protein
MELKEIKQEIDSIKTDIQKFNGNPAHAISLAPYKFGVIF